MKEAEIAGLIERFADLPDSRVEGRTDHDLLDIVVLALCAVMSGAAGWDDIEDWGREREDWLRKYLRLRNGIPGHDTIRRVFELISPLALEQRFELEAEALQDLHPELGEAYSREIEAMGHKKASERRALLMRLSQRERGESVPM